MKKSVLALLAATALLAALPAQATKQAQERRDARDVRQDTRQESLNGWWRLIEARLAAQALEVTP